MVDDNIYETLYVIVDVLSILARDFSDQFSNTLVFEKCLVKSIWTNYAHTLASVAGSNKDWQGFKPTSH